MEKNKILFIFLAIMAISCLVSYSIFYFTAGYHQTLYKVIGIVIYIAFIAFGYLARRLYYTIKNLDESESGLMQTNL